MVHNYGITTSGRVKDELVVRQIAQLLDPHLASHQVCQELITEKGTAVAVKHLAETICSRAVWKESEEAVACAVYWVAWADWIISESFGRIGSAEYRLVWLNANLADRRFGKRLPRQPLLIARGWWRALDGLVCPLSRYRAVLHEDGILTTWKLEALA
ncbi:MAG: hypothetical protein ACOC0M_00160 [Halomonas sp.]